MIAYLARRLIHVAFVVFTVSTVVFLIMHAIGDPTRLLVNPEGTGEDLSRLRSSLGLDRPLLEQYLSFMSGVIQGDFGRSFRYQQSALPLVLSRLPATLLLAGVSFGAMVPLAVLLGVIAAVHRNSALDYVTTSIAVAGRAMPTFFLGLLLILLFSVNLRVLPASGYGRPEQLLMPALTLGVGLLATVARLVRSAMLEVLPQDYIRTARGKGLSPSAVLFRHALRNGMLPVVTLVALQVGNILTGAVIVETIFAWPGVGRLVVESIFAYDFPLVQASVFLIAMLFVATNLAADLVYAVVDPRIRTGS